MMPVVIFVRVSTDKQVTDRQVSELSQVASQNGWDVVSVVKETISGNAAAEDRTGLTEVLEMVTQGKVKKVLIHEVSRLSRRNSVAHAALEVLDKHDVSLYWHNNRMETILPNGRRNPAAGIMFALLSEMAKAERDMLAERIKSGLDEARRKGVKLGRPAGQVSTEKFLEAHKATVALIQRNPGLSIRNLAKLAEKAPGTIVRIQRALA